MRIIKFIVDHIVFASQCFNDCIQVGRRDGLAQQDAMKFPGRPQDGYSFDLIFYNNLKNWMMYENN